MKTSETFEGNETANTGGSENGVQIVTTNLSQIVSCLLFFRLHMQSTFYCAIPTCIWTYDISPVLVVFLYQCEIYFFICSYVFFHVGAAM